MGKDNPNSVRLAKERERMRVWPILESRHTPNNFAQYVYKKIIRQDPCVYCGKPAETKQTIDHINPKSSAGASSWENYAPACFACNNEKRSVDLLQFLLSRMTSSAHER